MTSEPVPAPGGRRHNGLPAASWSSVADVDPRVGDHLLDLLYLNDIAAFLQPTVDYDVFTRAASLPGQPTDRLWVDRRRVEDARRLVAAEAAAAGRGANEPAPAAAEPWAGQSDDSVWEQLVADYDRPVSEPVPPWPAAEDLGEARTATPTTSPDLAAAVPPPSPPPPATESGPAAGGQPTAESGEAEDAERYVPPPPPPLPRLAPATVAAVLSIVFGLFVLVAPDLLQLDTRTGLTLGILGIAVGVGALVWRMRDGTDDDRGPDDGAVV